MTKKKALKLVSENKLQVGVLYSDTLDPLIPSESTMRFVQSDEKYLYFMPVKNCSCYMSTSGGFFKMARVPNPENKLHYWRVAD